MDAVPLAVRLVVADKLGEEVDVLTVLTVGTMILVDRAVAEAVNDPQIYFVKIQHILYHPQEYRRYPDKLLNYYYGCHSLFDFSYGKFTTFSKYSNVL